MKKLLCSIIILLSLTLLYTETKNTEIVEYIDSFLNSKDYTQTEVEEYVIRGSAEFSYFTSPKSDRMFYQFLAIHSKGNTKFIYTEPEHHIWFIRSEITLYPEPNTLESAELSISYWYYTYYTGKLYLFDEDTKTFTELDKLTENPTELPDNPEPVNMNEYEFLHALASQVR